MKSHRKTEREREQEREMEKDKRQRKTMGTERGMNQRGSDI